MITAPVETWNVIPSHPGHEASSLGRIRRVGSSATLCPSPATRRRYLVVDLCEGGTQYVHRLCMESTGTPIKGLVVHHINGCCQDNRLENLQALTKAENTRRSFEEDRSAHTLKGERNPDLWNRGSLTPVQVQTIRRARESGKRGAIGKLAEQYGVTYAAASAAARGITYRYIGATALESEIAKQEALSERAARKATAQVARAKAARAANPKK